MTDILNLTNETFRVEVEGAVAEVKPGETVDSNLAPFIALGLIYHNRTHFDLVRKAFAVCGLTISVQIESKTMKELRERLAK